MAQRLVDTVRRAGRIDTDEIAQLVCTKGLSWLIDDDTLTAVEILTARYATGDHLGPWRHQARAMPAAAAVGAALADSGLSAYVRKHINVHGHYSFRLPTSAAPGAR